MFYDNRNEFYFEGKRLVRDPWGRVVQRNGRLPKMESPPPNATDEQIATYRTLLATLSIEHRAQLTFTFV